MKPTLKQLSYFSFVLLLCSCLKNKKDLDVLYDCDIENAKNLKTVTDVKDIYTIDLGKSWKTELYFDEYQSKIYSADTTKALTEAYIIEATDFNAPLKLDSTFVDYLRQKVNSVPRAVILKEQRLLFRGKESLYLFSYQKTDAQDHYNLKLYIPNRRRHLILEAKLFGSENLDTKVCKALQTFESVQFLDDKQN